MDKIDIADLRDCKPSGRLYGGRAGRKEGILIDGEPWICKYPRPAKELGNGHVPSDSSSPLSEYLGSHIYGLLNIPVHETRLGYRNGKIICACKDFTGGGGNRVLYEFSKVKTTLDDDASDGFEQSPSDGSSTFLSDVLATIETSDILRTIGTREVLDRFWDMFVVDAFIKNPDRNNGNWGVLWDGGSYRLAPVFDNGSSLFSKRTDSVFERRVDDANALAEDAFGTNVSCYLLMGEDGRPHHIKPFEYMARSSNPDLRRAVKRFAASVDLRGIERLLASIPEEAYGWTIMTGRRREAQLAILRERLEYGILPLV